MMKKILLLSLIAIGFQTLSAQETFTRRDTLHGGLRPERTCFDVLRYDLNIKINPDERTIVGYNDITFKIVEKTSKIQLDLFSNMQIDSIVMNAKQLNYTREFDAVFITLPNPLEVDSNQHSIKFYYSGIPALIASSFSIAFHLL